MSGASWDRLPQEIRQQIIKEYLNSIFEDKFDNYYHMPYGYLWHGVNHHTTAVFSSVGYAFGAECRLPLEQMLKFLREENDYYIGRQAQLKEAIDHNKLPRVPVPSGGSQIAPHARPGYDRARHELLEMRQRIVPYGKVIRREYMDSYLGDDAVLKIFLRAVTLLTRVLDRLKRQQRMRQTSNPLIVDGKIDTMELGMLAVTEKEKIVCERLYTRACAMYGLPAPTKEQRVEPKMLLDYRAANGMKRSYSPI